MERIRKEQEALKQKYPEPTDPSAYKKWETDYHLAHKQKVVPLHLKYKKIKGPLEAYVVKGKYELGQVLDEIPTDAVPVDEFFKQKK